MSIDNNSAGDAGVSAGWLNFNMVCAAGCILFSVFLFLVIPHQIEKPLVLLGTSGNTLDAALFPNLVAAGLFVIGAWYLRQSVRMSERNLLRLLDREALVNLTVTTAILLGYAALLEPLGFMVSSALMSGLLAVFFGARNPVALLIVSIGIPVLIYQVFTRALKVFLPEFPEF